MYESCHNKEVISREVKYYNQETYKKLVVNNKAAAIAEARRRHLM